MTAKISIDDKTLEQIQREGELNVVDDHGVPLVLMTVDARKNLRTLMYDDSDWSEDEQNAVMAQALDDPEGWGAPGMDDYDKLYGDKPQADGEVQ